MANRQIQDHLASWMLKRTTASGNATKGSLVRTRKRDELAQYQRKIKKLDLGHCALDEQRGQGPKSTPKFRFSASFELVMLFPSTRVLLPRWYIG